MDVMTALVSEAGREIVINVPNRGAIADLEPDDVVEVPCRVDRTGVSPRPCARLPESVRGLVESVKTYERTLIAAALNRSAVQARLAMLQCPIIGQWELAGALSDALIAGDPEYLGYLAR
jgi:6-phospho-beta-glucosidase